MGNMLHFNKLMSTQQNWICNIIRNRVNRGLQNYDIQYYTIWQLPTAKSLF